MLAKWIEYFPEFLPGLKVTMELTGAALVIGLPLGVLLALASISPRRGIKWPAIAVVEIGRGLPGLIVLYVIYYGFPQIGLTWGSFLCAAVGLGFSTGAYTAEIFRAGVNAVPVGQHDASWALGLSRSQEFRLVVLPQAIRIVIPALVGFSILLYQGTSLAFAIGVPELLSRAYNVASISYQFTAALTLAGVMYAAISLLAVALLRFRWPRRGEAVLEDTTQV